MAKVWIELTEKEKTEVNREMCETSQKNMVVYYSAEIKAALLGKSLPKHISKTLFGNGIMVRSGSGGRQGLRFKIDQNVFKKYRGLIEK
ncbi:MAG: hypothetical protein ABSA11_07675 [Candidatus Bathyarchaeia archaeon]|jgi:hypothetical protein